MIKKLEYLKAYTINIEKASKTDDSSRIEQLIGRIASFMGK